MLKRLPIELLVNICAMLDVRSIVNFSSTCKNAYRAAEDQVLWKHLVKSYYDFDVPRGVAYPKRLFVRLYLQRIDIGGAAVAKHKNSLKMLIQRMRTEISHLNKQLVEQESTELWLSQIGYTQRKVMDSFNNLRSAAASAKTDVARYNRILVLRNEWEKKTWNVVVL